MFGRVRMKPVGTISFLLGLSVAMAACVSNKADHAEFIARTPPGAVQPGRIVVAPTEISIFSLDTVGQQHPSTSDGTVFNEEWTGAAETAINDALAAKLSSDGTEVIFTTRDTFGFVEYERANPRLQWAISAAISTEIEMAREGGLVPLKKPAPKKVGFDFGPISERHEADCVLFVYLRDNFFSSRSIFSRSFIETVVSPYYGQSDLHRHDFGKATASLLRLRAGTIVWHAELYNLPGDSREQSGAEAIVRKLFATYPGCNHAEN